jgi:hypothetical protein
MLDPFRGKSRSNPEKLGQNGPFWMATRIELLGPFFKPEFALKLALK